MRVDDRMNLYNAAKAVVLVKDGQQATYLLSIKRDPGSSNEGKLEFPGGRFEPNEAPRAALLRELFEEEQSGTFAQLAGARANLYFPMIVLNARYFLFPFQLSADEFGRLSHHPEESFGFELVAPSMLLADRQVLTPKTSIIVDVLQPAR